jgi:hypothetical protein
MYGWKSADILMTQSLLIRLHGYIRRDINLGYNYIT